MAGKEPLRNSLILRAATRFMLPLLILFSVFLLLRGHHEPGGGFSGGLVAAAAFVLFGLAFGIAEVRSAFPLEPLRLIGVGLVVALISGSMPLLNGQAILTGLWISVPGFPGLYVGTPLAFDVGVYLVVLGVTLSIIFPLAEE